MNWNEFNSIFQTERDCLKYIASFKIMKCIRCTSNCLNTSNLRKMRCLQCHQTFSILYGSIFISHRHLWHLGFISSLDEWTPSMEFQPQMLQENWVWHIKLLEKWVIKLEVSCQTRICIYCWSNSTNVWNVSFTYGFKTSRKIFNK